LSEEQAQDRETARVTRIDGAHPLRSEKLAAPEPPSAQVLAATAGLAETHAVEQVRKQASQIARHLRAKQQQIDQREAQLNARVAQLEHELRASRLSEREREHQFAEREQELCQQVCDLQQQLASLSVVELTAEEQLKRRHQELDQREAELEAREYRLVVGQTSIAAEAEAWRHTHEQWRAQRQQREVELATRAQALAATAALLDRQTMWLQEDRRRWDQDHERAQEELQQLREHLSVQQHTFEHESAETRQRLAAWQESLLQRETSLEHLKQQVRDAHRETIELRLAAEQLWQQTALEASPVEATRALAELRTRLTDEFLTQRRELAEREDALTEAVQRLDQRCQEFLRQRHEWQRGAQHQQAVLEEQAARIAAREREIDARSHALRACEAAWQRERCELQSDIRALLTPPQPSHHEP